MEVYQDQNLVDIADAYASVEKQNEEKIEDGEQVNGKIAGEVYFAVSSLLPDLKKIGGTSRTGIKRVQELSSSPGIPEPYKCIASIPVDDWRFFERAVHEFLKQSRVYPNREFFLISDDDVSKLCDQIQGKSKFSDKEETNWTFAMETVYQKQNTRKRKGDYILSIFNFVQVDISC
jgi:hypothetical protein